jgi:ABC-type glutathione transport system ATPase component
MELIAEYANRLAVMKGGSILLEGSTKEVFSKPEILVESSLKPPQITILGQALTKYGTPPDVLTIDEMEKTLTISQSS